MYSLLKNPQNNGYHSVSKGGGAWLKWLKESTF